MKAVSKLFIYGYGQQAQLCRYYFKFFYNINVHGFIIDLETKESSSDGLPLIKLEDFLANTNPNQVEIFIGVGGIALNAVRTFYYNVFLSRGFKLVNCIDPNMIFHENSKVGINSLIIENTTVSPFVTIGDNTAFLYSGIGHHSIINDNVTIIGSMLAGNVTIEESVFISGNCFINQGITIGKFSLISAGCNITKDVPPYSVISSSKQRIIDSRRVKLLGMSYNQFISTKI